MSEYKPPFPPSSRGRRDAHFYGGRKSLCGKGRHSSTAKQQNHLKAKSTERRAPSHCSAEPRCHSNTVIPKTFSPPARGTKREKEIAVLHSRRDGGDGTIPLRCPTGFPPTDWWLERTSSSTAACTPCQKGKDAANGHSWPNTMLAEKVLVKAVCCILALATSLREEGPMSCRGFLSELPFPSGGGIPIHHPASRGRGGSAASVRRLCAKHARPKALI